MNRKESLMDEITETKSELVVFDEVAAIIADYKVKNEELTFDYASKEGAKQAKSHIAKLRKVKTKVGEIHKEAKAEALAFGRRLDAKKNEYNEEVDKMIVFHKKPLDVIEAEETEKALAKQREYADAEAKRIAEIEVRERAIILAEEKIAREKAEAEETIRREKAIEAERVMKEQLEKIARIEEEKRIAEEEAEKLRIQAEEKAKAEAEAEEERLAEKAAEEAFEARLAEDKMRKIELDITVSEGKYTFISYTNDFRIHCLRYGEPWMIFEKGHKAISSLMYEYQGLKLTKGEKNELPTSKTS